jgi:hypothetical protein
VLSARPVQQQEECCGYCTCSLDGHIHVYRHEKGTHPEPRPVFCSTTCIAHYNARRIVEMRTFSR